ncbi:hypothetical protein [Aliikangiella sp. IMCC44359]|uniref:hypothetical protein n=1 Tax=Aliikangiella sp. IMCC44359 TaxID=3459125 RepID=UPI00403A921E
MKFFPSIYLLMPIALLLSSCKTMLKMQDYPNKKIMLRENISGAQSKRTQVLIVPSKSKLEIAKEKSANRILDGKLAEIIASTGAEIIDRELQKKLLSEIKRCENQGYALGRQCFKSKVPDIIISTEITSIDLSSSFSRASSSKDKKGKTYKTPASCSYKTNFESLVNIYNMQKLQLKESVKIKGNKSISQDTNNAKCPFNQALLESSITASIQDAAKYYGSDIKTLFSPKAKVIEYRWGNNQKDNFFRLSIGKSEGARPGLEVVIMRDEAETTNSPSQYDFSSEIARGVIMKTDSQYREAWVQVKSRESALRVKAGDFAKIIYTAPACKDKFYKGLCEIF